MPNVTPVDPHDDAALRAWYDAWLRGLVAGRGRCHRRGYREIAALLRVPNRFTRADAFALVNRGGEVVGASLLERPQVENRRMVITELAVSPEYRRRGYGSTLLAHARALADGDGRDTLFGEVFQPVDGDPQPGIAFAERHGFTAKGRQHHLLLELPVSGENLAAPVAAGYRIRTWAGPSHEADLAALAGLFTAMSADVPTGDLDFEPSVWDAQRVAAIEQRRVERDFLVLTAVAVTPDGGFAGYSHLFVPGELPEIAVQEDTLVLRAHRGNALGTALKAANLRLLAERFPERRRVHTWNAVQNAPMLAVNTALGFRRTELVYGYQG